MSDDERLTVRGRPASVCNWTLTFKFPKKAQYQEFINRYMKEVDIPFDFSYKEDSDAPCNRYFFLGDKSNYTSRDFGEV